MSKNKEPLDVEAKLAELRKSLTDDVNEMLNDNDCHRFLTARKYDIPKTLEMVNKWAHWFTHPFTDLDCQPDIKNLCPKDCLAHETDSKEALLEDVYFYSYCGDDKEGRPLYIEKLGLLASKYAFITKNLTEDEMYLRHIRMQELMASRRVANSVKYNKHIGKQIAILDLKGFPLWPDSKGFRWIKRCIEIDEAYYPETLEHLFVINAPIWFTAIWAIVKPWIDEVTVEKIQIIGAAYEPILKKYIADDQLPVDLGGTYENYPWKWPDNYKL